MKESRSSSFGASAAASIAFIGGSFLATTALATTITNPAPLSPGQSSLSVPLWGTTASNYTTSPKGKALARCIDGVCATGGVSSSELLSLLSGTGGFLELAGTTNLNPWGDDDVVFAVAFGGDAADGVQSVEIPGLSSWSTDVQACDPSLSSLLPCPSSGSGAVAARDSDGDVTFSATSSTGFPVNPVLIGQATDVYAVYTDAPISKLGPDPMVVVTYSNGSTVDYSGLSLLAPTTTVPEPSVLGLLAAGLATLGFGLGLRRRAR
jgi:hypothetical protein